MIAAEPPKLTRNEGLKEGNPLLAGTIAQTLADSSTDRFTDDDYEFLKFHGIYQQDDRDKRKVAKHYMFMVRTKFPGGVLTAPQYLACDKLSTEYGENTMRVTTRQDFQFHGIVKTNLRQAMKSLNEALISTIAACGDVERNVMAPPTPATSPLVDEVLAEARRLSDALAPKTSAYHTIWIEGKELDLSDKTNVDFVDPLYGKRYLPRKFKTAFAIPPLNDIDIFTNDLGFVVIAENGRLAGYNLLAGGGMGMSHGNTHTFPRLADVIGFIAPGHLEVFAKAVLTVHRDFGDRTNRKHARLKYVLEERGAEWFRLELEQRAGIKLAPARPFEFTRQGDLLGWHQQTNGNYFLGLFIENGRIKDANGYQLKTGLRKTIERFQPEIRLTASQNLLLVNVPPEQRAGIQRVLEEHGVSVDNPFSRTRLASMACPALPTCGLALAESERTLPEFLTRLEGLLAEVGLPEEELIVRMTGCPNGCARPYMAEIAFVGKAPNKYQIYFGGNESGTRLNRLYKDSVKGDELLNELRTVLTRYRQERQAGERFGDFCARVIWGETDVTI
ncbi:MAG TPA: NADPH-dependent assimilatory sulfite reductase hemoprotein subunit [Candidatus Binatia bacterium]|jgi:sulfite reductase (NADPH) hemoprotein beta-component|nr:NADPH-dependent assimilatory sulfite reductase hemoprotein subunit [Candidatus Binatia bacterium]